MEIKYFGQFLIERKVITPEQLLQAIRLQDMTNIPLGVFALKTGFIDQKSYDQIRSFQLTNNTSFYTAATRLGIISPEKVNQLLSWQISNNLLLGEALVQEKILTQEAVDQNLREFRAQQSISELNILSAISSHPHSEVINVLIQSFVNLFRYLLAMKPRIGGFDLVSVPPSGYDYIAVQKIHGDFDMRLFLCFREEMICLISSALLKKEMKEIDELTLDSAREFINIVAGYSCSSLSLENLKVDPGIPEIHPAEKVEARGESLKVPFLLPKGIVEMRMFF